MFPTTTYQSRREALCGLLHGLEGKVLLSGNDNAGMNCLANTYHFRQDSTFLYFIGIDQPGLAAVIDPATGTTEVFGDELSMDDIVWTGEMPSIREQAAHAGIGRVRPRAELAEALRGGKVHYLPPYRGDHTLLLQDLVGGSAKEIKAGVSEKLIRAIVQIRSCKTEEEILEIEKAVRITNDMHLAAMRVARPGVNEAEVHAALMDVIHRRDTHWSFPAIVSRDGQILHNHAHDQLLRKGDLILVDCGAETKMHYAGDMTRAFPVDPTFTDRQKAVYNVCLQAQLDAISTLRPGTLYRDSHLTAARTIAAGLKELGLMKGDPAEAVAAGAHALFFPHGLGHMMGMDVHDMENLGEDYIGYDEQVKRSSQFGLAFLRLGKALEAGFVLTVEPGIYFIPQLIDQWRAEGTCAEFINFEEAEQYKDFGGIRIEDDYLITADGARLLGDPVPKTVAEVETYRANHA